MSRPRSSPAWIGCGISIRSLLTVTRKKDRERTILELVYDASRFDSVRGSESPDFELQHHNEDTYFGVEVTEFYLFESDARIKNIPGYMSDLFAGGEPRHKDDVDALRVEKVAWRKADGSEEQIIDAIKRKLPGVSTYVNKVASVIERKSQRLMAYAHGLSHVNLIILDHSNRLIGTSPDYFYDHFFTTKLRDVLARAGFREIYFVTKFKSEKKAYIPLKALFLMSEFHLFYWALSEYQPDSEYESVRSELELFMYFMLKQGVRVDLVETAEGEPELVGGNLGILVSESGLVFRDYADFKQPHNPVSSKQHHGCSSLDPSFLHFLEEYRDRTSFITDIAFEVRQDAPL